jgi:hypothetical protein
VAARIGYDAFFAWAKRTVIAGIARQGGAFVAKVDLIDEDGIDHGARELQTQGACSDLLDAVALTIAIAIDPQSLASPGPRPPPAPDPPPAGPPPPPSVVPELPPTESPRETPATTPSREGSLGIEAFAGGVVSTQVAPGTAIGLAVGGALSWHVVSVGFEGRVDAPAGKTAPGGGSVSSWLVLGALAPCLHFGPALACALLQVGSSQSSGEGEGDTRSRSALWLALGARVGAAIGVRPNTELRIRADVLANLDPVTLELNGGTAWPAPRVGGSLGIDGVVHFR